MVAHGVNKKEIAEAIAIAMFIAGGSQLDWADAYGESVYDIIFGEKKLRSQKKINRKKIKVAAVEIELRAKSVFYYSFTIIFLFGMKVLSNTFIFRACYSKNIMCVFILSVF